LYRVYHKHDYTFNVKHIHMSKITNMAAGDIARLQRILHKALELNVKGNRPKG